MLIRRVLSGTIGSLACAWVIGIPLYFAWTLDAPRISELVLTVLDRSGFRWLLHVSIQFVLVPFGLVVVLREAWRRVPSRAWRGGIAGLAFGIWANTVFLVVPGLGGYACLPGACFALLLTDGPDTGPRFYVAVLAGNLLFYPPFGALLNIRRGTPPPTRIAEPEQV